MWGTPISALLNSPTVFARYLDTRRQGPVPHQDMCSNSVQQSASRWWVTRKFVDSVLSPSLSPGAAHDAMVICQRCQALERVLAHATQREAGFQRTWRGTRCWNKGTNTPCSFYCSLHYRADRSNLLVTLPRQARPVCALSQCGLSVYVSRITHNADTGIVRQRCTSWSDRSPLVSWV